MPQEFGYGASWLFVYDASELEEGLENHPQLSKDLPDGRHVILRKLPERGMFGARYRAGISSEYRPEEVVLWASSAEGLIEKVQAAVKESEEDQRND